jgi:hypothetical protein
LVDLGAYVGSTVPKLLIMQRLVAIYAQGVIMFSSRNAQDRTWFSVFGVLMLSMVLGLSACSSGSSDSNDDSNAGGGGDFAPPSPGQPCAANNQCDFTVQLSDQTDQTQNTASWTQQEFSYAHGWPNAPAQLQQLGTVWTSDQGQLFNYLQTTNFTDYNPLSASPPTALYVLDNKGLSIGMTLQYANQTLQGIQSGEGYWFFDLSDARAEPGKPRFTLNPDKGPYQFTIHSYDNTGGQTRELAVWLSSNWITQGTSYTSVDKLWNDGHRNHWMVADDSHIAYVGGLYDFARSNSNGFNLKLDRDLDGSLMNLSTTYNLFHVKNGVPANCVTSPTSCTLEFVGQFATPVRGKIIIAGSGRVSGYELLDVTDTQKYSSPDSAQAKYRVNSGLIELSSCDASMGPAIDIAGITVGFSPKRGDSSVLLNNQYLPMVAMEKAVEGNTVEACSNNRPVQVYDVKMVGNWVDAADGLEVQGDGSTLRYTYLHIADDSIKVAADNVTYSQTTVLQGDVGTGGLINLGSYGTGRPISVGLVNGVYVHRITHKPSGNQGVTGYYGASLVAAPTCAYGNNVMGVTVEFLRVNDLSDGISSVNRPFNIGVGDSYGLESCSGKKPTTVSKLKFKDFAIYLDPLADSTIFNGTQGRFSSPQPPLPNNTLRDQGTYGSVSNIEFWDKKSPNNTVQGKVAFHADNTAYAYFVCGVGSAAGEGQCWTTNGPGGVKNVLYSPNGYNFENIDFPYN